MYHVSGHKNAPKTERALPGLVVNVCFNKLWPEKNSPSFLLTQCIMPEIPSFFSSLCRLLSSLCAEVRSGVQVSVVGTFSCEEQCLSGAVRANEENVRPRLSMWPSNSTPREIRPHKNVDTNVPSSVIQHS